jgi:hypothetical protein
LNRVESPDTKFPPNVAELENPLVRTFQLRVDGSNALGLFVADILLTRAGACLWSHVAHRIHSGRRLLLLNEVEDVHDLVLTQVEVFLRFVEVAGDGNAAFDLVPGHEGELRLAFG